jgi:hypothetical protein
MKGNPVSYLSVVSAALVPALVPPAAFADDATSCQNVGEALKQLCPAPAPSPLFMNPAIIAALLGLFGAWIKYLYDSWRKQKTINVTILTEVARLLEVSGGHLGWWQRKRKEKDTDQVMIALQTPVFDSQMQNLGDLDRRYAGAIVRFYGYVKFINSLQETQAHYRKRHKGAEFDERYEKAVSDLLKLYTETFRPAFDEYGIETRFQTPRP